MSEPKLSYRYSIEVLRSGQPRPYADTEREYKVYGEQYRTWGAKPEDRNKWYPWIPVVRQEQEYFPLLRLLTGCNFYGSSDEEGANWASPMLQWMKVDKEKGVIHFFVKEAYTD